MLRPPKADKSLAKESGEKFHERIKRVWIVFGIALAVEALQVTPSKMSFSGMEFNLQSGSSLSGLLYLFSFIYTLFGVYRFVQRSTSYEVSGGNYLRGLIYNCAPKRKSLIHLTKKEVRKLKLECRTYMALFKTINGLTIFFPALAVLLFKFSQVKAAAILIVFGSQAIIPPFRF